MVIHITQSHLDRLEVMRPSGSRFVIEVMELVGEERYRELIRAGKTTKPLIMEALYEQMRNQTTKSSTNESFISGKDRAARNHL